MINIIKADFYRVFKSIAIYIGIVVMLFIIGTSIYAVQPGNIGTINVNSVSTNETYSSAMTDMTVTELTSLSLTDFRKIMLKAEGYELDRDILAQNINLYYVFIFVAALTIAVEFSGGKVKNTLSSAISRNKYFASKTLFVTLLCLLFFFANTYITYFANIIFNNKNLASSLGTVTKITLMQLPAILALISVLNGLAFITKKTSYFNTISIMLIMIFQLLLNFAIKLFNIDEKFANYELQIMLSKLANNPSHSYIVHSYIICAIIIIVCNLLGYLSFKKSEIK